MLHKKTPQPPTPPPKKNKQCAHIFLHYPLQQYSMHGHILDLQKQGATTGERDFIEQIKVPIFLEAALAIEAM